jgi:hypothetical protein
MTGGWMPRTIRPAVWIAMTALAAGLALMVLNGAGFRWDPFGLTQRRLERAEAGAAAGRAEAQARRLEARGAEDQARRLEHLNQRDAAAGRVTAVAIDQARSAHDADHVLEPDRADRLRGHDDQLCRLASDLDGCAGAAASAGGGDAAVRPRRPARWSDGR